MKEDTQISLPPGGELIGNDGFYCVRFGEYEFGDWSNTKEGAAKSAWSKWEQLSGITQKQFEGLLRAAYFLKGFAEHEAEMEPHHRSSAYSEAFDILKSLKGIIDASSIETIKDVEIAGKIKESK